MLAKPTAMVVPIVVIVLEHMVLGREIKQVLRSVWPWLLLAVPCAIAAKLIQPAPHAADAAAPLWARPLVAMDALAFYLYKLVWPVKLGFDYGRTPAYVRASGLIAWTWLLPAAVALLAWWNWRRGGRAIAAGLLMMVIVLLPVLGLVPFDFQTYSDRRRSLSLPGDARSCADRHVADLASSDQAGGFHRRLRPRGAGRAHVRPNGALARLARALRPRPGRQPAQLRRLQPSRFDGQRIGSSRRGDPAHSAGDGDPPRRCALFDLRRSASSERAGPMKRSPPTAKR
jgi:hypothetical protein